MSVKPAAGDPVAGGWSALARGDWEEAWRCFCVAVAQQESPEALEGLSWAAWWRADADALFDARERAFRAYRVVGRNREAARVAAWLGTDSVDFRGEVAVAQGWLRRARSLLADCGPCPELGPILVGAVDGKGIPMVKPAPAAKTVRLGKGHKRQKKKMATVGCVFSQQPRPRTPDDVVASLFALPAPDQPEQQADGTNKRRERPGRPQRKRVWASLLSSKDTFITDVRAEMARRDPDHERDWVIVTDGERALQRRVTKTFEHDDITLVLDLLHALEKLWKAAYVFHPEGSAKATTFVRERALRILRGQSSQVVKGLRQMVTKHRLQGIKRKTLLDVAAYYHRNRERMRYDHYLANGWPIASGSVEGACKNLVKDRFERSGMRWSLTGAEAMLGLRATYLSGDFDAYWAFHVQQEQQRLYPEGLWTVVEK